MKVTDIVKKRIDQFDDGYIFTYADFDVDINKESALKVALHRMVKSGKIARYSKGRFYKPKQSIFGTLKPDEYEIIKDLLIKDNKPIGYITGYQIFNSFHLTTQVPNVTQIGVNKDKKAIKRDYYKISFVRQWNEITSKNIPLLQLLDCIRYIKRIPDTNITKSYKRILHLINELSIEDKARLAKLALNYPASTRVLVGTMFEKLELTEYAEKLHKSLNVSTTYEFYFKQGVIENPDKWRIKL